MSGGVIPKKDKLTDDERIEILRNLTAEYAKAKTYLPRSKSPLEFDANGTWDQAHWQMLTNAGGPGIAAREGDQLKITHVAFEGDKLVLEINGGLKSGTRFRDRLEVGVGNSTRPVSSGSGVATLGTNLAINFHKPMENLTAADVKKILAPLMTFDLRTVSRLYVETLPPEMQKAIADKRALEGMDREQVKLALGNPVTKYRETKEGIDLEDWIFGRAPGKITFVTFQGAKVVKVKEQYAGLGSETAPTRIIVP
ncbi:MAG: hypothetical protein EBY17_24210 [Acidobacteriia bacterium]|nr:hypothetical protein [Terriglobia bacterium]